jgi:hypothetical protein
MKTNGLAFCLCFVLFLTGCGAYELAQDAARRDPQQQQDQLVQKTEQLEVMNHLAGWYLQFHERNSKSPADLEQLLRSVSNPTAERTAAAIQSTRRLASGGEISIDWGIDLAAWRASGQDLAKHRIAWTAKTELYNVYLDGTGRVHDVLAEKFATVQTMTQAPQVASKSAAAGEASSLSGLNGSLTTTPANPIPPPASRLLGPNSTPTQFVVALKSGEKIRIVQALGLLLGSPTAQPSSEISRAILGAIKTGDTGVQLTGVMALEKWGTAAEAAELEAVAANSNNFGLQAQARRIVPILKGRN